MTALVRLFVFALAVEAVVEIFLHSDMPLIKWWREKVTPRWSFLKDLFCCGWCLSLWVAAVLLGLVALGLAWILYVLAVHRLSNFLHFGWALLKKARFREEPHALRDQERRK